VKKCILAILAFSLIGGLSAQEVKIGNGVLTFSGKAATGVFFDSDDVPMKDDMGADINRGFGYHGADGFVYLWNESDTKNAIRGDLTAAYVNGNAGLRIRLRGDWNPKNDAKGNTIDRYAYGWLNLLGDTIKLTGGYIDLSDNVWGTLGDGDWDIGGGGLRVEIKPFNISFLKEIGGGGGGSLGD
jgi:hypothetical protein